MSPYCVIFKYVSGTSDDIVFPVAILEMLRLA